ncbi:uncharacterized protein TNCV_2016411 [Trichonephila clavipes]|nr:uncharacterized protein TNCV_2016411 [Trichonephila clavipes]
MACYAEDCGFQMLNEDEIVTSCKKNPTLSTIKRMKTRATATKIARVYRHRWQQLWNGTNNNQSAVLLNYCCSRESELAAKK